MFQTTFASAWPTLGQTVVHFLWQGALIGLVTAVVLGCMRRSSSRARYVVASGAMLLSLASFAATFLATLLGSSGGGMFPIVLPIQLMGTGFTAELTSDLGATTIAAWCWVAGVLYMSLRFALNGYRAQRLKTRGVSAPDAGWQRSFETLKDALGVARTVRLLRSSLAEVPMVVGWLSPVILVPACAFTTLNPEQLKTLLAHELAHIRRHDHLLNAAQAVVEIVLFFHPVTWWISKQMRVEREYCCDDSAMEVTGNPKQLAEALACMETLRTVTPRATALASNGGPLMQRIQRILGVRLDGQRSLFGWHLPVGLALTGILAVAGTAYASPTPEPDGEQVAEDRAAQLGRDYEAAVKRIQAALDAGEITKEEADKRFAGLRQGVAIKKRASSTEDELKARYKDMQKRLEAAVEAGKLTREQADRKLLELRKELAKKHEAHEAKENDARLERLRRASVEIEEAVKAGKLTPEEGRKKLELIRAKMRASKTSAERFVDTGSGQHKSADYDGMKRRIDAAVKAGKITPAQGKERLEAWKRDMKAKAAALEQEAKAVKARIDAAVKSSKITPAQGKERFEAWKKAATEKHAAGRGERKLESIAAELKEMVRAGKITQEEADAKLDALKKKAKAEREAAGNAR